MRRAVVIFIEKKRNLLIQFGCLYTSFKHIRSTDTDLVVFGTPEALSYVPDDCVKVECTPLSASPEWKSYPRVNGTSCLVSENADILDRYDYLLRSDVDVFLTPAWNEYYPKTYTTGRGYHVNNDEVRKNLKRVAGSLGLRHQGIYNLGEAHYGESPMIREVCRLTVSVARHLLAKEFKDFKGKWPGWFRGVTMMYSSEIAVNHLLDHVHLDRGKLDHPSTSDQSIHGIPHIHCWHTSSMFSKFDFALGKYDDINPNTLRLDQVRDYCLYMALKSKRDMPWLYQ